MSEHDAQPLPASERARDVPVASFERVLVRAYCATDGSHDYPSPAAVPPACPFCGQIWRELEVRW